MKQKKSLTKNKKRNFKHGSSKIKYINSRKVSDITNLLVDDAHFKSEKVKLPVNIALIFDF